MTRFILISFLFLGFAFYELSGGSEFDAEATRMSRIEAAPVIAEEVVVQAAATPRTLEPVSENVTRVKLDLNSLDDVLRPGQRRAAADVIPTSLPEADKAPEEIVVLPSLLVDQPVIRPVDFGAAPARAVTGVTKQVRQVTGSSVNVRGGPGTEYSVVNRLVRGDEVEVLQDPGNGWVKLRPVGGGPVGWMAEFLLSQG